MFFFLLGIEKLMTFRCDPQTHLGQATIVTRWRLIALIYRDKQSYTKYQKVTKIPRLAKNKLTAIRQFVHNS